MEDAILSFLAHISQFPLSGVALIYAVSAILQIFFGPYPGDTVLIFGGCLGGIGQVWVSGVAFVSYVFFTLLSTIIVYELGYRKGESILRWKLMKMAFPETGQDVVRNRLARYGIPLLMVCKFIPGINTLMILFSGVMHYERKRAYTAIIIGVLIHNCLYYYVGTRIGRNWNNIGDFLSTYNRIVLSIVGVALVAYLILKLMQRRRKQRSVHDANCSDPRPNASHQLHRYSHTLWRTASPRMRGQQRTGKRTCQGIRRSAAQRRG